jgi:hypothetical protein
MARRKRKIPPDSADGQRASHVEVGDAERVLLDEIAARLNLVAHQAAEQVVRLVRFADLTCSRVRASGSRVVSHSCSAFISPRPL